MRKLNYLLSIVFVFVAVMACAQGRQYSMYAVGFYNQENLFDTCHDYGKNDYAFLPDGDYKWTAMKYKHKLHNMARALADMGTDKTPQGCAFIGLAEVENGNCLRDLCAQEPLAKRNMKWVLYEGVDRRGIDVGFLYNPSLFKLDKSKTFLEPYETADSTLKTRGFLVVRGTMANEPVCVIVCHLPSRLHGDDTNRVNGAKQVTAIKERIMKEDKSVKFFVMGDMNDDPTDRSMTKGLRGKQHINEVQEGDMYNPWISVIKSGTGTLQYNGGWNLFDQILISPNLLVKNSEKNQKLVMNDCKQLKYYSSHVFRRDYLFQTEGKYKGNPKRTHAGGQWLDGYSDHLPVVMYLLKEK